MYMKSYYKVEKHLYFIWQIACLRKMFLAASFSSFSSAQCDKCERRAEIDPWPSLAFAIHFFYIKCEGKFSFHIICIFVFLHLQSWILCVS